jgi:ribosomal protein S18 acetylase RimI-like enzyme
MILEPLRDDHDIASILEYFADEQKASGYDRPDPADLASALRRGSMSAVVALEGDEALGLIGWKTGSGQGAISLLAVSGSVDQSDDSVRIAGALIRRAQEAVEAEGGTRIAHILRQTSSEGIQQAFCEAGFEAVKVERWVKNLSDGVQVPATPIGFEIQPWRPRFTRQVVELFLTIRRDPLESLLWPDYDTPEGVTELVDSLTSPLPVVPPAVSCVAMDQTGAIVGYVLARVTRQGSGWIGEVGVAPEHQGKKLGRALVATSLHAMAQHRLSHAALTVLATNESAIRLYESHDFSRQSAQCAFVWSRH